MSGPQHVVHKIVYRLDGAAWHTEQPFEVPSDAELVDVDWDTREPLGVALWYRTGQPEDRGAVWRLFVRGTGQEFPPAARHLATVVRDGFVWHLFDATGESVWTAAL